MEEKLKLVGWILIFVLCIAVMFFGVRFAMDKDSDNQKLMEIANPLTEVKSVSEMQVYLGYEVPIIEDKEVAKYYVIGEGKYATHGRVIYSDKAQFEIEKSNSDVSGIYGGVKQTEESIGGTKVIIYTYEDLIYGVWQYGEYSYSYSVVNTDQNTLNLDINKIMKIIDR